MSFLDRIKGREPGPPAAADASAPRMDEPFPPESPMESTVRLGQSTLMPGERVGDADSSIISEAAPSELAADFADSRHPGTASADDVFASGLPLLGGWPLARQQ
ncbi:MAG TPA: methyl-accepting chemotaxis protein, partial [Rubrivivax sp.]|nr:methyl-accepting chemotaxis protein [Rubrivivax sp.]